jgi:ElaB/YqjD/DUF883 family membrane-anchored ribosome-binding protein
MTIWRRRSHADEIAARFSALKTDFRALQGDLRELTEEMNGAASDAIRTTNRAAQDALESVNDWTTNNIGSLQSSVRRQPLAAIILSMSIGALFGALFSRR